MSHSPLLEPRWAQSDFLASGGEERLTGVMTSPLSERQETRPRLKQIRLWAQCELLSFVWSVRL